MAYNKTVWVNDSVPAINETNLNKIEQGIYDADERSTNNETNIGDLTQLETTDKSSVVNAINEINNKYNYSTTESIIGTFKNKPLYSKVIDFTISSTINVWQVVETIANIEDIKEINGTVEASSNEIYNLFFFDYGTWYYNKSNGNINYMPKLNFIANKPGQIVIEYTKTTD